MGLLSFLGKKTVGKAADANAKIEAMERKDLVEATCAIAVLTMHVSGGASAEETKAAEGILCNHPKLKNQGAFVSETFTNYDRMVKEAGFMFAKGQLLRQIADVKGEPEEKEDVFLTGVSVAAADGTIDEKEKALLDQIGNSLGLRLDAYL